MNRVVNRLVLAAALVLGSSGASAAPYSNVYFFGDSLSDSGNNAFVFDVVSGAPGLLRTPVPTPSNSFIPTYPYATPVGGRYSNGAVWAESFAAALGLSAAPSLLGGTNYAYGGAVTGPLGNTNPFVNFPNNFPPSLTTQVATFLSAYPQAPSDALYVVAGGGNDARALITQAATNIFNGIDPTADIIAGAMAYAGYVDAMVDSLELAGADHILVWDTPNVGLTPALLAAGPQAAGLATLVSQTMNAYLLQALADDIAAGVKLFDVFGFGNSVAADPAAYGLANTTDACSAAANLAACQAAGFNYFFWDGIHPTAYAHQLIAAAALQAIPEPTGLALLAVALVGLGFIRRRALRA